MVTEGNSKILSDENCVRMKNMIALENKFLTRSGYKKYNSVQYDGRINLIYEFKRVVGGNLKIIGYGDKLYEGYKILSPISQWKMNDNAATTVVVDSVGSNNGTAQQNTNALHTTGKINGALTFNGNGGYIDCGDPDNLSFGDGTSDSPFSLCAWIKRASLADRVIILSKYYTTTSPCRVEYTLKIKDDGKLYFILCDNSGAGAEDRKGICTTNVFLEDTNWHHIVATYDGSSTIAGMKLYIDGDEKETSIVYDGVNYVAMRNTSESFKIGCYSDSLGHHEFFDGIIDDVRVYDFVLKAAEIGVLFNSGYGTEDENP